MRTRIFLIVTIGIFLICQNLSAQNCWEGTEFLTYDESVIDSIEIIDIEYSNIPENDRVVVGVHTNGFPFIAGFNKSGEVDSSFGDNGGKVFLFEENLELIDFDLNTINGEIYALLYDSTNYFASKLDSNGQFDLAFGTDGYIQLNIANEVNLLDIRLHNGTGIYITGSYNENDTNIGIAALLLNMNTAEIISTFGVNNPLTITETLNNLTSTNNHITNVNRMDGKFFFTIIDENEAKSFGFIRVDEFGNLIETEDDAVIFEEGIEYTFNNGIYHFPYEPINSDSKEFITHGTVSINMAIPFKGETLGAIYMLNDFNEGVTTFTKEMFCLPSTVDYLDFDIGDHSWSNVFRPIYFSGIANGNIFLASSTDEDFCFFDDGFVNSIPKNIKSFNSQTTSTLDSLLVFTENISNDLALNFKANLYTNAQNDNSTCLSVSVEPEHEANFNFEVFPNPVTSNNIVIKFKANSFDEIQIALYDLNGKQLLSNNIENNQSNNLIQEQITLPNELSNGIYILKVMQNNIISTKKIIVK